MLKIHIHKGRKFVDSSEIYTQMGLRWRAYSRWIKEAVIESPSGIPMQGRDFVFVKDREHIKTRRRQLLYFSLDFAREICFATKTSGAKKVREWIIGL
jgi:phage anti-repressor protein